MIATIKLSEKDDRKRRTIKIISEIEVREDDFEVLKILVNNDTTTMYELTETLYGNKKDSSKNKIWQSIYRLRLMGFDIYTRAKIGYRLRDTIYIEWGKIWNYVQNVPMYSLVDMLIQI